MSEVISRLLHFCTSTCLKSFHTYTFFPFILLLPLILSSCSSVKFTGEERKTETRKEPEKEIEQPIPVVRLPEVITPVRLLVDDTFNEISFSVEGTILIKDGEKQVALVNNGNKVSLSTSGNIIALTIGDNIFKSDVFIFSPSGDTQKINFNGRNYRGSVIISGKGRIINTLSLEDYLKGVLPAEMPLGKGTENYEALKAFAICARTYTIMKLKEKKRDFDLYMDVRDQVYGGSDKEKELSDKAIEETTGLILKYNNEPAVMFYSASCGGYSEEGGNVFATAKDKPYLSIVQDGNDPYCIITPRFQWEETYTTDQFLSRFIKAGLITDDYNKIKSLEINSRFNSGRVNELELVVLSNSGESKAVKIYGNQIRSIIRSADNKGILRSTMFDISISGDNIVIKGRGYGHGVGLCQWGAIGQSKLGKGYMEILNHYFPGTTVAVF